MSLGFSFLQNRPDVQNYPRGRQGDSFKGHECSKGNISSTGRLNYKTTALMYIRYSIFVTHIANSLVSVYQTL